MASTELEACLMGPGRREEEEAREEGPEEGPAMEGE